MQSLLFGLCECGCGQMTARASMTNNARGAVKGEPLRFVHGHNSAKHADLRTLSPDEYLRAKNRRDRQDDPAFRANEERARKRYLETERGRELRRLRDRRYAAANPERSRSKAKARRARLKGVWVESVDPLVVLERDDGVCGICGGDVDPFDFHLDHVVPLACGGEHSYANTKPAHPQCNQRKGAKEDYIHHGE